MKKTERRAALAPFVSILKSHLDLGSDRVELPDGTYWHTPILETDTRKLLQLCKRIEIDFDFVKLDLGSYRVKIHAINQDTEASYTL